MLKTNKLIGKKSEYEQIYILYDDDDETKFQSFMIKYKERTHETSFILIEDDTRIVNNQVYIFPKRINGSIVIKDINNITMRVDTVFNSTQYHRVQMLEGFPVIKFDNTTMECNNCVVVWDGFPIKRN